MTFVYLAIFAIQAAVDAFFPSYPLTLANH
jgi:hypothetical protein